MSYEGNFGDFSFSNWWRDVVEQFIPGYKKADESFSKKVTEIGEGGKDVYDAYEDVADGGVDSQDYRPWMSLLPGFDTLQEYQDKNRMWEDYYKNTGKYPNYTSRMQTFGSLSNLASSLGSDARSLFNVGKLYKNF